MLTTATHLRRSTVTLGGLLCPSPAATDGRPGWGARQPAAGPAALCGLSVAPQTPARAVRTYAVVPSWVHTDLRIARAPPHCQCSRHHPRCGGNV